MKIAIFSYKIINQQPSFPNIRKISSKAEGKFQYNNGKEGLAFCNILQTVTAMPTYAGGSFSHFESVINHRSTIKFPYGDEAKARMIMNTILNSARLNSIWQLAVQTFFNNLRNNITDENWKSTDHYSSTARNKQ